MSTRKALHLHRKREALTLNPATAVGQKSTQSTPMRHLGVVENSGLWFWGSGFWGKDRDEESTLRTCELDEKSTKSRMTILILSLLFVMLLWHGSIVS